MLRSLKSGLVLAVSLAVAPIGFATSGFVDKTAFAAPTYRPGAMKPHSTRAYTAGGELRVCNEGPVPVRLYISNSLTSQSSVSLLEPGRCNQSWGHMMTVENYSDVPANVWAFGSLGGRIGPGGHH
jgi:hypothetical protein